MDQHNKLPSKYQIGDTISTYNIIDGEVVAVRFTIGKVYYDVLDKVRGKIVEGIDSSNIQETDNATI